MQGLGGFLPLALFFEVISLDYFSCKRFGDFCVTLDHFSFVAFDVNIVICSVSIQLPAVRLKQFYEVSCFQVFPSSLYIIIRLLCAFVKRGTEKHYKILYAHFVRIIQSEQVIA